MGSPLQLLVNRPAVFEPYAAHWWMPVARLACQSDRYGGGINYFVQDLCALLLAWATPTSAPAAAAAGGAASEDGGMALDTDTGAAAGAAAAGGTPAPTTATVWPPLKPAARDPEQRAHASDLVAHLMRGVAPGNKPLLRYNLDLVKGFCELWRDALTVNTAALADQLARTTVRERSDNMVGIQLLAVVLANNLWPFGSVAQGVGGLGRKGLGGRAWEEGCADQPQRRWRPPALRAQHGDGPIAQGLFGPAGRESGL